MNQPYTWQENAILLIAAPELLVIALFSVWGILRLLRWWTERP